MTEHIMLPLWLGGVKIGTVVADSQGRMGWTLENKPEHKAVKEELSRVGVDFDGIRLELFNEEEAPCSATICSWDIFEPDQTDKYFMGCDNLGPHKRHHNSHTGASWETFDKKEASTVLGPKEIKNRVGPHLLTEEDSVKIPQVRQQFENLMNTLDELLPDGRCKSVTMTELETAQMWAVKALAIRGPVTDEDRETVEEKFARMGMKPEDVFVTPPKTREEVLYPKAVQEKRAEIVDEAFARLTPPTEPSPARTREEAQYQAAQNAFSAYQSRKPDVETRPCASTRTMSQIFPGIRPTEDYVLHCSLVEPHNLHIDKKHGYSWPTTAQPPTDG